MTPAAMLERLNDAAGEDAVAAMCGEWLATTHRRRPRLLWARPEAPARAPHYLTFIRGLPCCSCGAPPPSDAHHCGPRGIGQKTDDYRTVPLCRRCHESRHAAGPSEVAWVLSRVIDTLVLYLRIVEQR